MINMYAMEDIDWLGYKMTRDNPYTFHHIIKREKGGEERFDNGAILTTLSHRYLHIIEYKEPAIYHSLNGILLIINKQLHLPDQDQKEIIELLFKMFEQKHLKDKNAKGKKLIKYDYLKRTAN